MIPLKNILFICTGNSVRSQMAEAFLRYYAGKFFNVYSAGVNPKPIHPKTIESMNERGMSLSGQFAKDISLYLGHQSFDTLITLSEEAANYNLTQLPGINEHLHWLFDDPAAFVGNPEQTTQKFRETRDQIEEKILVWLDTVQYPAFPDRLYIDMTS